MYENVRERSGFFLHTWAVSSSDLFRSCLFVRPFVCKCFTFSTFSPEPQGQFQLNLAQSIIGWRELKFVKTEGLRPLSIGRLRFLEHVLELKKKFPKTIWQEKLKIVWNYWRMRVTPSNCAIFLLKSGPVLHILVRF